MFQQERNHVVQIRIGFHRVNSPIHDVACVGGIGRSGRLVIACDGAVLMLGSAHFDVSYSLRKERGPDGSQGATQANQDA